MTQLGIMVEGQEDLSWERRVLACRAMFQFMPQSLVEWRAKGFIGGSAQQVIDQLEEFVAAGASRFMLAHYSPDDLESLELLAQGVLPHFVHG
ncbi:MAG TPA: hypothetical protein VFD70_19570 [Anaerolineae bacterium]|nr:hypothetical protein [Anaerolineae bacterium]